MKKLLWANKIKTHRDFGEALFDAFLGDTAGGEGALGRKAVGDVFD